MKLSGGLKEDGIVVGNAYDKYDSKNYLVKKIMSGFDRSLNGFVNDVKPKTIHEVGCGEGYWVLDWISQGYKARGSDFSKKVINLAKENATNRGLDHQAFFEKSIYELKDQTDSADLLVCCEVLEHLDNPCDALEALAKICHNKIIFSVPREPLWCYLNLLRAKYITSFGNTPGHIQHWSKKEFISLISEYFIVEEVSSPIPWTMLLCRAKQG